MKFCIMGHFIWVFAVCTGSLLWAKLSIKEFPFLKGLRKATTCIILAVNSIFVGPDLVQIFGRGYPQKRYQSQVLSYHFFSSVT